MIFAKAEEAALESCKSCKEICKSCKAVSSISKKLQQKLQAASAPHDTTPTNRGLLHRKNIHFRQPLVFSQPLSCFFGNLWVVYRFRRLRPTNSLFQRDWHSLGVACPIQRCIPNASVWAHAASSRITTHNCSATMNIERFMEQIPDRPKLIANCNHISNWKG